MSELKGACIIGQSGGPTAVINASAYGVIRTALDTGCITRVLGAAHGIKGVLEDRLYDMSQEDPAELELLKYTPSSALGSCRYKLADPDKDDTDYKRILEIFQKYNVRYFFYNGGNDSMDTCNKISKYMQKVGYECRIMGVPKTIDNDLNGTDHCPGFASAAKYIATSCAEVWQDAHVYDTGMVTIIEIMGRHAGWLAGSAALASLTGCGPDLVYLPEVDFDLDQFVADVTEIYNKTGKCLVAVSEGIHYADGRFVSEAETSATDGFGHAQLGGLAVKPVSYTHLSTYTIGYDTACNTALESIDKLRDTMQSHERCSVVEVMGRHAGHVALNVGVACGATAVLVPEQQVDYEADLMEPIRRARLAGRTHFMVIVAEGVEGGAYGVAQKINEATALDTRVTILGHVQRGGAPTVRDRIAATYMGYEAVRLLAEGKSCRVVAMQGEAYVDYDITEALSMHKGLDQQTYTVMRALTGVQ